MDVGLRDFISAAHWHWQLAECRQALGGAAALYVNCPEAAEALGAGTGALCWEPSAAQLRQLRRPGRAGRVVVAARPWRQHWPLLGLCSRVSEEKLCQELREAGFEVTNLRVASYPVEISLEKWLRVAELEEEEEAEEKFLNFEDRLLLITAEVPSWCARRAKRARLELPLAQRMALDGFWAPLTVLSTSEAAEALAKLDAHAERVIGADAKAEDLQGEQRFKLHLLYPWAADLVRHPVILEAVRSALGTENVLAWFSEVNAKAPNSACHAAPHQDGIYASLVPNDAVITVWLALTDAMAEMGGLFFQRGSHLRGPLPHAVDGELQNLIGFRCLAPLDDAEDERCVELRAGDASLHGFRTLHWSGPNLTNERRVGLALRYCRADVRRSRPLRRESAFLACGALDDRGAFDAETEPRQAFGEEEQRCHADALARERANYCADAVDI